MDNRWEEVLCEENGYQLIVEREEFGKNDDDIIEVEIVEREDEKERLVVNNEKLMDILKRFIGEYIKSKKNGENQDLKKWLTMRLKEEFPEKKEEALEKEAEELIGGVILAKQKYDEVSKKRDLGISPSDILGKEISQAIYGSSAEEVKEELRGIKKTLERENISSIYKVAREYEVAPKIVAFQKMDRYFENINETIAKGNEKMINSLMTKNGSINQNPHLDGFIFEQFHENTFNIDVVLKDISGVRAEALVPISGKGYSKNSVDLVIKVKNGEGEWVAKRKYQAKLSDNPEALFKKGNYKFQRKLYGEGHESVGNTKIEYESTESISISKSDTKIIQKKVQKGDLDSATHNFENNIDVKMLSRQIAKQSLTSGAIGMGIGMAMSTGMKLAQGEKIEAEEVILDGLKVGGSVGLSTAIAGGLKTAIEKKVITGTVARLLGKNSIIGTIAFSALSLIGVACSVGSGEMSLKNGMKEAGTILASTYAGIQGSIAGVALVGGIIASVGTILAPIVAAVAGTIGYFVGSNVAGAIARGCVEISSVVYEGVTGIAKAGYEAVKSVASGVWNGVKSVASGAWNAIKSAGSAIASFFGW